MLALAGISCSPRRVPIMHDHDQPTFFRLQPCLYICRICKITCCPACRLTDDDVAYLLTLPSLSCYIMLLGDIPADLYISALACRFYFSTAVITSCLALIWSKVQHVRTRIARFVRWVESGLFTCRDRALDEIEHRLCAHGDGGELGECRPGHAHAVVRTRDTRIHDCPRDIGQVTRCRVRLQGCGLI